MSKLFSEFHLGTLKLQNRLVMAPMTRCRAINNIPHVLMAQYYQQRASAGLIITEGTAPAPNGLGYARIPGIFSAQQVEGWAQVTTAVPGIQGTGRVSLTSPIAMNSEPCGPMPMPAIAKPAKPAPEVKIMSLCLAGTSLCFFRSPLNL